MCVLVEHWTAAMPFHPSHFQVLEVSPLINPTLWDWVSSTWGDSRLSRYEQLLVAESQLDSTWTLHPKGTNLILSVSDAAINYHIVFTRKTLLCLVFISSFPPVLSQHSLPAATVRIWTHIGKYFIYLFLKVQSTYLALLLMWVPTKYNTVQRKTKRLWTRIACIHISRKQITKFKTPYFLHRGIIICDCCLSIFPKQQSGFHV